MSYEIVKGLKLNKNKQEVWIKSSSNNVYPKRFHWWHCKSLSKIWKEEGIEKVHKEILKAYWGGDFQKTNNLYEKSVILAKIKDLFPYDWSNVGKGKEYSTEQLENDLYQNWLNYKNRRKGVFYIKNPSWGMDGAYVKGKSLRKVYLTAGIDFAKSFNSYEDAFVYMASFKDGYVIEEKGN